VNAGPRVVGVDLSLTSTGVAVVERDGAVAVHRLQPKGMSGHERLRWIVEHVEALCSPLFAPRDEWADVVVVEALFVGGKTQGSLGERFGLFWLLRDRLYSLGIPATTMEPSQLKKYATGRGNAGKDEVLLGVARRYPDVEITGNDQADALALAAAARDHYGAPLAVVPQVHREALAKVVWPDLA